MPHAISPASSPPELEDDTIMSEAVAQPAEAGALQTPDAAMEEASEAEKEAEEKTNLDDIFDDDDDEDDEFASSTAQTKEEESSQEQYA